MNNPGLEALAALASAAPPTESRVPGDANRSTERGTTVREGGTTETPTATTTTQSVQPNQGSDQGLNPTQSAQWQQIMSSLASSGANSNQLGSNPLSSGPNLALLAGMQANQANPQHDSSSLLMAMQNMAYYQLIAQSQAASQNQLSALSSLAAQISRTNPQAAALALARQNPLPSFMKDTTSANTVMSHHHVDAKTSPATTQSSQVGSKPANSKTTSVAAVQKRNPTLAVQKRSATSVVAPRAGVVPPIAPQPPAGLELRFRMENDEAMSDGPVGGKREVKRAANRRSAQLSRKRKKVFIEELKEENDELRRKEQILKSLPDLVVVFDSSGKLGFVSHSVSRLLDFTAEELEGTSFWDRLCEDSVRLLKAAFMDSLATREAGSETAPLGAGVWELRLVDKNDSQKLVALNGVVHFAGDRPECVCSIRPRDKGDASSSGGNKKSGHPTVSIDERQSATKFMEGPSSAKKGGLVGSGKAGELVRISDSGNSSGGSGESDSGSSDE